MQRRPPPDRRGTCALPVNVITVGEEVRYGVAKGVRENRKERLPSAQ